MKKIMLIVMTVLLMAGCSTIPNEYKVEPNESEIMYIESGAVLGSIFTVVISGTAYWYLDRYKDYF